jgi:hypothetical protein
VQHVATPHIARVSGDAVSSLAALFKTVVLQLVNAAVHDDEEPIRMPTPTLEALEHWYVPCYHNTASKLGCMCHVSIAKCFGYVLNLHG